MLLEKIQLEESEVILKTVRKHWFIIMTELLATFMMLLVPFVILLFLSWYDGGFIDLNLSLADHAKIITFGIVTWSLITVMMAFAIWTHYYLDLWIITDRRIIVIDQIHFFNRNVSIFRLERLQDIEFNISGLIPTLLNFGTIQAQTAAAHESNFKTSGLPDPRDLQGIIQKAMDQRLTYLSHNPNLTE